MLKSLSETRSDVVVGFSAGASAAWCAIAEYTTVFSGHLVCFYPTRMRKYVDKVPKCATTLVVPESEHSVDDIEMNKLF